MKILVQLRDVLRHNGITPKALRKNHTPAHAPVQEENFLDRGLTLLWEGTWEDEDQLAGEIYGQEADRSTNSYKKLKQRMTDEFANEIIGIGLASKQFDATQKGYYSAHREYLVAHILSMRGAKGAANYFYRRALRKAEKYDAYQIRMLVLTGLRDHAVISDKNSGEFERFNEQYQLSTEVVAANSDVSEYYGRLMLIYDGSPRTMRKIHERAVDYLAVLDGKYDLKKCGPKYTYSYYLLQLLAHYSIGEYQAAVVVSTKAIDHFAGLPVAYHQWVANFRINNIVFHSLLGHYDLGTVSYQRAQSIQYLGPSSWLNLQSAAFRLFCYGRRYLAAVEIYEAVVAKRWFRTKPTRYQERWRINRAYLHYLTLCGVTELEIDKSFRLGRFINSLPKISKQKGGGHVTIMIIHILFLIHQGKYQEAGEQIDKTEKYLTRYLQRGENYRSKCFLKILQQFAKVGFQPKRGRQSTRLWYNKLLTTPLSSPSQSYEMEVIPYEDLYAILLGIPLPFREEK